MGMASPARSQGPAGSTRSLTAARAADPQQEGTSQRRATPFTQPYMNGPMEPLKLMAELQAKAASKKVKWAELLAPVMVEEEAKVSPDSLDRFAVRICNMCCA